MVVRTSVPHPGEDGDPDLIEAHQRAPADALHHDGVDIVLGQDQHRCHAAALGVRRVLQDLDVAHLFADDVDEREARAAAEVAGTCGVEAAGKLRRDGDAGGLRRRSKQVSLSWWSGQAACAAFCALAASVSSACTCTRLK